MNALLLQTPSQLPLHLKALRKSRGLTQADLANRLRVTQSRYAQIERNPQSISTARLLEVFAALGVDVLLKLRGESHASRSARTPEPIKTPKKGEDW
jgi:HTH-type transcriptional regulator / antitoxin HipB